MSELRFAFRRLRRTPSLLLAATLLPAACGDAASTLDVSLQGFGEGPPATIQVLVKGADRTTALGLDDLHPDPETGVLRSGGVEVPGAGRLTVEVELADAAGTYRAEASWELQAAFEWHLDVWRSDENPMDTCFGCRASWRLEQEGGVGGVNAYWLILSGERRGSDVVY